MNVPQDNGIPGLFASSICKHLYERTVHPYSDSPHVPWTYHDIPDSRVDMPVAHVEWFHRYLQYVLAGSHLGHEHSVHPDSPAGYLSRYQPASAEFGSSGPSWASVVIVIAMLRQLWAPICS